MSAQETLFVFTIPLLLGIIFAISLTAGCSTYSPWYF